MKRRYLILNICALSLCFSCAKDYDINEPTLKVTVEKNNYKVGDTVVFNFEGESDFISFYSGEIGSQYKFHDQERIYKSNSVLTFKSAKYSGTNSDCCALKYSTDFNGKYDRESVRNANWNDISTRFFIPDIGTGATFFDSGESDISELFPLDNKPVYFAWFYKTAANSSRTLFQVIDFKLQNVIAEYPALSSVKYNFVDFKYKVVLGEGFDGATTVPNVNATRIYLTGILLNDTFKEAWAISAPIYKSEEVNLGLDKSLPIKIVSDAVSPSYQYIYTAPGEYTATFVVANSSVYGRKQMIKELKITIDQ
ncbi:DUF5017 domain-containing protein [Pedobacter sp. ASV1-7]|uniref:DUF5017 domain-containing protein n=1 Tax=Pedobacter sp. ASV1-7 TaxID=3145237 RepID=UPI0032E91D30